MTFTEEIKRYKIRIIVGCIVLFLIGYIIGTIMGYIAWRGYVDDAVEFLSDIQVLGRGDYDIETVKEQIDKVYEIHEKGDYFKTVDELEKLEEIYPNLQIESEFQRLMKKIK